MDLIKDRLAHIIRAKNLTATQFAEMMQIQPSNVSHLLSGRNKPSLDFLIKLKDIFPEYSFDWIILGKKPITVSERQPLLKEDIAQPLDLFQTQSIENEISNTPISEHNSFENNKLELKDLKIDTKILENVNSSKSVKQIIYIYEDHTFDIYDLRVR